MHTYRSRNKVKIPAEFKGSLSTNALKFEERKSAKNVILNNLTESASEARVFILINNLLREKLSLLTKNNLYIKSFINKIITSNREIEMKHRKKNHSNNIKNMFKNNIIFIIKEINEFVRKNNILLKEQIESKKEKKEKIQNNLEKEIENLNIVLEENSNKHFILEYKTEYKNNLIKILKENNDNLGCIQENDRYRFLNDELNQQDIDKFLGQYLSIFQQALLNVTQGWNKYKNKARKFELEIEELKKIIANPNNIDDRKKSHDSNEKYIFSTESDLFFMEFDEFEEDSREFSLETETMQTQTNPCEESNNNNQNNKNLNININSNSSNNIPNKKIPKINTNIKYNKINYVKNPNINNRRKSKNFLNKKEIYYLPQKNFTRSLIKNSEALTKCKQIEEPNKVCVLSKTNRNVSINSISKLNLKQIMFNKNKKYIQEEAKELAIKRYKVENEFNMSKSDIEDPNEVKIQMEVKELKKDIQRFKEKITKKKKIIREFKLFCKDILKKYEAYLINNNYINYSGKK